MAKKESYNDMLNLLESTIENLENNDLGLEEAMKEYEKGSKLVNKLYKILANLEGKFTTLKEASDRVNDDEN